MASGFRTKLVETLMAEGWSRREAQQVVEAVFASMVEALQRKETVELPFGKLVVVRNPPPARRWKLGNVARYWKSRYRVRFLEE